MSSKEKKTKQPTTDANSGTHPEGAEPPVAINAQYIKDFSFENPTPEKAFLPTSDSPELSVGLDVQTRQLQENTFEVVLEFQIKCARGKDTLYVLELEYGGIFTLNNIPGEMMSVVLLVQCSFLLFPYARQIIAQVTGEAGFPPLQLAPIDFAALYQQRAQEILAAAEQAQGSSATN